MEHLHFLSHGGSIKLGDNPAERTRYNECFNFAKLGSKYGLYSLRCGDGLRHLLSSSEVQGFLHGPTSAIDRSRDIHQSGALRKV